MENNLASLITSRMEGSGNWKRSYIFLRKRLFGGCLRPPFVPRKNFSTETMSGNWEKVVIGDKDRWLILENMLWPRNRIDADPHTTNKYAAFLDPCVTKFVCLRWKYLGTWVARVRSLNFCGKDQWENDTISVSDPNNCKAAWSWASFSLYLSQTLSIRGLFDILKGCVLDGRKHRLWGLEAVACNYQPTLEFVRLAVNV